MSNAAAATATPCPRQPFILHLFAFQPKRSVHGAPPLNPYSQPARQRWRAAQIAAAAVAKKSPPNVMK